MRRRPTNSSRHAIVHYVHTAVLCVLFGFFELSTGPPAHTTTILRVIDRHVHIVSFAALAFASLRTASFLCTCLFICLERKALGAPRQLHPVPDRIRHFQRGFAPPRNQVFTPYPPPSASPAHAALGAKATLRPAVPSRASPRFEGGAVDRAASA